MNYFLLQFLFFYFENFLIIKLNIGCNNQSRKMINNREKFSGK